MKKSLELPWRPYRRTWDFVLKVQEMAEIEKKVKYVAIPKRLSDLNDTLLASYQCFRAGIDC
ncbi:MAG: hypothetical protein LBC02_09910 [Planctomycetaceae bacterium]|nr:hypothetical protein [Planctomycetaceae bacterium]